MKFFIKLLFCILAFSVSTAFSQTYEVKNIKSFGAKGDGKTNDQVAFEKAASYFNNRGGNGTLVIPKGAYIIGKQTFTGGKPGKPAYEGSTVLQFVNIKKFKIEGSQQSVLRYDTGFHFGAFQPSNGNPYEHGKNYFIKYPYAAFLGSCIYFDSCRDISISDLELDGNNQHLILGGTYGDVGMQLPHLGLVLKNCTNILINKMQVHHFGQDGIYISNKQSNENNNIVLSNSSSEYNFRQGLSWVGGNNLHVINCKFNHTGKSKFSSPPAAGVDIEAEIGPINNGVFENCDFTDNTGVGLVADNGQSNDCLFINCTFWGATNWSVWITRPGFTFNSCNIYGSFVHGYDSPNEKDATKFIKCNFEDKPYNGNEPYGRYLIESNGRKRVSFTDCNFTANKKKLCWVDIRTISTPDEKYQFTNCSFTVKNAGYTNKDFVAILRGLRLKNCVFDFKDPDAKKKGFYLGGYGGKDNVDAGGNKIIYSADK